MHYYSFTLVKTRGQRKYSDYLIYLNNLGLQDKTAYRMFELEKGLHLHAMFVSKTPITRSSVKLHKYGWSIRLDELQTPEDIGRWTMYCMKGLENQVETMLEVNDIVFEFESRLPLDEVLDVIHAGTHWYNEDDSNEYRDLPDIRKMISSCS